MLEVQEQKKHCVMKDPVDLQDLYFVFYGSGKSSYPHIRQDPELQRAVDISYYPLLSSPFQWPMVYKIKGVSQLAGEIEKVY